MNKSYDNELAEKAIGQLDIIPRGEYGLGLPTGNRSASVRSADVRAEFELFRPIRNIPRQQRDIVEACMNAYHRIGILRNVIDMMSSFGCQGIQVLHPNKTREKIYKAWFRKVRGPERSERFLNGLYRAGNVIVKRQMAKLPASDMRSLQKSVASLTVDSEYERDPSPRKNEIPIEYIFLNPATIEMAGGELATFLGHPVYTLRIPNFIITMIKTPKTPSQKQLVADLPDFIRRPIQAGEKFIVLDNDKLAVFHYMKDDWQQWAMPITYSILADLILYEKMKLADMAALEGAISHIRIWKLGSLEHGIQVGPVLHQKLHDMLLSNVGGGAMDLIWDAAINLQETGTDVSKFLGSEKYEPILKSIHAGLGIPQSLGGGSSSGAGFTNNAISLKTLIERLQYGRDLLTEFWTKELRIMQESLGDTKPARMVYDNMNLYDEAAEKMLWFQLYDRHLVDDATIQEKFGMIPEVIAMRIKREETQRQNGSKPPKSTPFHDPQSDHELTKIALQQGTISPTEAGVDKKPKKPGDKSFLDFQAKQHKKNQIQNQKTGVPGQGRPKHSRDTGPRKQRTPQPSTKSSFNMFELQEWAKEAQQVIAPIAHEFYLSKNNKKTLRALNTEQSEELEQLKFQLLCAVPPLTEAAELINTTSILVNDIHINPLPILNEVQTIYQDLVSSYVVRKGVKPTIDKQRDMMTSAYAMWKVGV